MSVLLDVRGVSKSFATGGLWRKSRRHSALVVDNVSLKLRRGERLALVGESGSGKSTLGRLMVGLAIASHGSVHLEGRDLALLPPDELRQARRRLQMVFQDAAGSLNPRMRVQAILAEALALVESRNLQGRAEALLHPLGLDTALLRRFPHQLSGGQRQRVAIARALACEPALLVADEAVAALDATLKGQLLDQLALDSRRSSRTLVWITHDLATVPRAAEGIAVMYGGRIVEKASVEVLLAGSLHPYTQSLLAAVPRLEPGRRRPKLAGEPPDPMNLPPGCCFHPRCPLAESRCREQVPPLAEISAGHFVACHLATPGKAAPARPPGLV